jgi:membrane-bound lytic murein transglycosylase B
MRVPTLGGTRLFTAALITAVPLSMGSLAPIVMHSVNTSDQVVPVAQTIAPRTTIAGDLALTTKAERERKIAVSSAKGSRVWTASALADHDLPSAALRAYRHAARTVEATSGCSIPWTLLAGIGRVESDHGRYGGSVLGNDGVPRPAIIGVALNGAGAVAAIRDTDNGRFDGDRTWDRAVGPMQFIPATWRIWGADGNADGIRDPQNIEDAALAAAGYLCARGRDLSRADDLRAAVLSYNHSQRYLSTVLGIVQAVTSGALAGP